MATNREYAESVIKTVAPLLANPKMIDDPEAREILMEMDDLAQDLSKVLG